MARLLPQDWTEEPTLSVSGKGGTFEQQLLTTVGEFVERYCAHWPVTSATHDMTTASYEEMRVSELPVVDFEYLDLYDPEQLEETSQAPFERTTTTKWIPGKNLLTGETVHVPTELVYMGEHTDWEGQSANFFSTSNGCACGSDPDSAVLGALYEGLERDAVMCSWFRETPPRRLDLSEWPQLDALREKVTTANSEIHVLEFDSETDVHTLGGMYVNRRDRRPKFMLAGGSNLDFRSAVRDALLEAEQGIKALKKAAAFEEHPNVDVTTITNLEDNIRYYIHPDNFDELSVLLNGEEVRPGPEERRTLSDDEDELEGCLEAFDNVEATPIGFDLTTPDVQELGMSVVKVYIPELVSLSRPSYPPRRHPRFENDELKERAHPFP